MADCGGSGPGFCQGYGWWGGTSDYLVLDRIPGLDPGSLPPSVAGVNLIGGPQWRITAEAALAFARDTGGGAEKMASRSFDAVIWGK